MKCKATKQEKRLDRAYTLRGIAMELDGHLANGSEFLFTDKHGDDVSKELFALRKKLLLDIIESLHSRADRLEDRWLDSTRTIG